ncbi:hypothetical protein HD884_000794 [Ochrobactrum intermedium]|nr:hypothetical protein [Brucella intermedia]
MAMLDMRLETKQAALAIEDVELDGSFSGYASVFGLPDLGNDVIERGAFARSLAKGGVSGVRMLWQHDAAEPIGVWTAIREDARGLYVEGRLAKGVARARDALELMRRRAGRLVHRLSHRQGAQGCPHRPARHHRRSLGNLGRHLPMRPQACQQRQGGDCRRSVNSNAGSRGIRG